MYTLFVYIYTHTIDIYILFSIHRIKHAKARVEVPHYFVRIAEFDHDLPFNILYVEAGRQGFVYFLRCKLEI